MQISAPGTIIGSTASRVGIFIAWRPINHRPQTGKPPSHSATPELLQLLTLRRRRFCGLGYLCRKLLAFRLCEIFELLFRHGLSHLFRRAFQAGFLAFATFRR